VSWPQRKLGEIMPKRTGSINPSKFENETFELYSIPSFDVNQPEIIKGAEIGSSKKLVQPGDILLSKIVPHIRRCWIVPEVNGLRQIASGEWIIFRSSDVNGEFLKYFLTSDVFHSKFISTISGVGGSLMRARPSEVEKIDYPFPPLPVQKQIAAVLEKADTLRSQCQQMEQELNSLAQSVFLDMFGDPVANPKGWPIKKFKDIGSAQLGKMLSAKSKQGENPKKYLRNANVRWRKIELHDLLEMDFNEKEMNKFGLEYGDLLVCEGGDVGRCAIWREELSDCYYQKALHRVRVNKDIVKPEYVQEYFYWMSKLGGLLASVSEVTFSHLTAAKMAELNVPVPPIGLQEDFIERINVINEGLKNIEESKAAYKQNFNSLMQRAFKGELELKDVA